MGNAWAERDVLSRFYKKDSGIVDYRVKTGWQIDSLLGVHATCEMRPNSSHLMAELLNLAHLEDQPQPQPPPPGDNVLCTRLFLPLSASPTGPACPSRAAQRSTAPQPQQALS